MEETKEIMNKIRGIKLCLMAHPDNEEHSEFADRISDLDDMPDEILELLESKDESIAKLQAFKDYVHKRLDDANIEKEPNGEHSKHGCRIGDRLDIILKL